MRGDAADFGRLVIQAWRVSRGLPALRTPGQTDPSENPLSDDQCRILAQSVNRLTRALVAAELVHRQEYGPGGEQGCDKRRNASASCHGKAADSAQENMWEYCLIVEIRESLTTLQAGPRPGLVSTWVSRGSLCEPGLSLTVR